MSEKNKDTTPGSNEAEKQPSTTHEYLLLILVATKEEGSTFSIEIPKKDATAFSQRVRMALSRLRSIKKAQTGKVNNFELCGTAIPNENNPEMVTMVFKRRKSKHNLIRDITQELEV